VAAKRIAQDVLASADSPLPSPPSAMKRYSIMPTYQPSPVESSRRGFEEEGFEDDDDKEDEYVEPPRMKSLLDDHAGGTTARIDDLVDEQSFAKLVDDDDGRTRHQATYEDDSYVEEAGQATNLGLDEPEDTLFGIPRGQQQLRKPNAHDDDDSFTNERQQARGFHMHGINDMDTLHGGQLLESEPFEASPLAGRRLNN
jgi:hypothetical protein